MAEERRLQSSETCLRFVFPVPPFYRIRLAGLCIVTQKNYHFLQAGSSREPLSNKLLTIVSKLKERKITGDVRIFTWQDWGVAMRMKIGATPEDPRNRPPVAVLMLI
jgi:hypothetical protein